jgi:hypothetical protein
LYLNEGRFRQLDINVERMRDRPENRLWGVGDCGRRLAETGFPRTSASTSAMGL